MGSHVITHSCTNCGACADACPVEAISGEGETYRIDPNTCSDCGSCVDTCPVGAIRRI